MKIFLKEPLNYSSSEVNKLINTLELTTVDHLSKSHEIYFDPKINQSVVKDDD